MTKHNYREAQPRTSGFFKVYDDHACCFAAFYNGRSFNCGPYIGGNLMVNLPLEDEEVIEWETWK